MDNDAVDKIINGQSDTRSGEIDPELMLEFISEAKEHLESIEMNVLNLENEPENMEIIHSLFRSFHTLKGLAGFVNMRLLQEIAHQTETLMDECRKGKTKVDKRIVDAILNSSDYIKKLCDCTCLNDNEAFKHEVEEYLRALENRDLTESKCDSAEGNTVTGLKIKKLGEILIDQGKVNEADIKEILEKQKEEYPQLKIGQVAIKEKKVEVKDVLQSMRIQEEAKTILQADTKTVNSRIQSVNEGSYIRIPTIKADNLVDMLGELIIIQSLIEREASLRFNSNDSFMNNLMRMSRITKEVQNTSMSLRMVSLKSTFQKINRISRDTVSQLGKSVNIKIVGEDTEIDRGVAEKLLDPLIHIVKNSLSHGIENEKERHGAGKPSVGNVSIEAYSKNGNVYIEVTDDGRGISIDKVYRKALEKNLIEKSVNYSDDEIMNFIFLPGFSTADKIDNISGRGVGLDVVKTEISKIGGRVEIDSQEGKGSKFILKIPINLAIMDGTIVDITGSSYIIPSVNVKQIFKPEKQQLVSIRGRESMIRIRDEVIQIIPIQKVLGKKIDGNNDGQELVLVLELDQKKKALPITSVIGKKEIVVKPLGNEFSNLDFISGASILGDGKVSLILDVETLFKREVDL